MRVIYHPHAEAELIEAAQYYERSIAGLGVRFLDEAEAAVALIREAPQRWRYYGGRCAAVLDASFSVRDLLPSIL